MPSTHHQPHLNIAILLLLVSLFISADAASPMDELLRGFIYTTKDMVDRFLARAHVPRLSISTDPKGPISFQLDPNGGAGELAQPCPLCRPLPPNALTGTWHLVLWSRNFLLNTMAELDSEIDRLEASTPLQQAKTLAEWLSDPPDMRCPQLIVLDAQESTKFEFAYRLGGDNSGRSKSMVGRWMRNVDGAYTWYLSPSITLHLCTAFSNMMNEEASSHQSNATHPRRRTRPEDDFIVLNQIDSSLTRCDNFIVLMRDYGPSRRIAQLRDWLESRKGVEGPFNKIEKVQCDVGYWSGGDGGDNGSVMPST